ncbi:probable serine/threonine-protein kinase pats1 [Saccostrea cucullata]|uniref:probable serine/threonine-protein kinase pats1 n=1 Tax=Saccostrea cuccullata TaxID=36930 RepID=UPI002ED04918
MDLRRDAVHYRGRSQDSVDHVTWLWRYGREARPDIVRSCIGLHPHWDIYIIDNKPYRKPSKILGYLAKVRCLLYCVLISEKYRIKFIEQSHKIIMDKIKQRYFPDITDDGSVDLPDGITETRDRVITFISDDIRHDVMYAFVTECLVKDSDLEFFLTTASRDVISEYCRSWEYKRSEGERCLYVPSEPEKMCDLFIDRLQLDIITHCTVSDWEIRDRISGRLGVPTEVLQWDQEARERYVEYAKRGTQTVHHARGMIVGCAGAGKTTLLKRLLGCSEEEIKKVKSTEGLEVHEEIFDLCDETKSLKARNINTGNKKEENSATNIDSKTLTFFDFGGQCAYYACHQIYLTRRAFYVVVLDASKRLDQKVDKSVCDQDGSVFHGWTYGDYFVFWIKSIHTYCSSNIDKDSKPTVLIVATHWEKEHRQYQDKNALLHILQQKLPKESNFSQYIVEKNCYCTYFPDETLHDLQQHIFDIASHQRWKENIPKEWVFFEIEMNQKKESERILDIEELTTKLNDGNGEQEEELKLKKDMLRYYHDAGKVLYFNEEGLKQYVIIDVQWFIDAFKHILTDKLHFQGIPAAQKDWDEYYKTGSLRDGLLTEIWKHKDKLTESGTEESDSDFEDDPRYLLYHKDNLLNFMQRLGLMAVGEESHYVPCMNRKEIESAVTDQIQKSDSKTSILIYRFSFLPFFLFFRLVVSCMQLEGWEVRMTNETSCLYRNAALFSVNEYNVVLSVTETSIQLQVFHHVKGRSLRKDETCKIQETIEVMLNDIAGTFHRGLMYERGFRCEEDCTRMIAVDISGRFVQDKYVYQKDGEMVCPLHPFINQHPLNATKLSEFWNLHRAEQRHT